MADISDDKEIGTMKEPLLFKNRLNTTSQIAIVGANLCPIESLDYEVMENDPFKQDRRTGTEVENFQYLVLKWVLAFLIGLATGLVGILNNIAVENIAGFKLLLTNNLMLEDKYYQAFAAYTGCNVVLAVAAASLCTYIAPAAAGSGIPEVFGSILGVAAGFVVGKKGPMVHTGACIVSSLGQGRLRKYRLTSKWLRYFKNASFWPSVIVFAYFN